MNRQVKNWLIIFVKAPSPGEVKTRLLSMLSAEEACELYRCLVRDTLDAAQPLKDVHVVVAYAADAHVPDLAWLDARQAMFLQKGRALGERLRHAFRQAFQQHAQHAVVVGSDAPDLSSLWLRRAFQALKRCDVVLGPTKDGGYHLIGLSRPTPSLFVDMPWSTPQLFERTIERIRRLQMSVRRLDPVADLDTPEDVRRYLGQQNPRHRRTRTARYLTNFAKETLRRVHVAHQKA